jgi:hypothetical protein
VVNTAVVAMNQLVQTSTAMIAQSTGVAEGLRREAQSLATVVARFNVGDRRAASEAGLLPVRAAAPTTLEANAAAAGPPRVSEDAVARAVVRDFFESVRPPANGVRRRD